MGDSSIGPFEGILCLAGPPGSGKTTAGLRVSEELGLPFFDLDRLVEEKTGSTVKRIFAESGEVTFRRLEFECLRRAILIRPSVLAVGGGCFLNRSALSLALEHTTVITLIASADVLASRCKSGSRPLAVTERDLESILESRRDHYLSLPNRIETDGLTMAEVAGRIESLLNDLTSLKGARTADPSP
jgi:shikimate kinase